MAQCRCECIHGEKVMSSVMGPSHAQRECPHSVTCTAHVHSGRYTLYSVCHYSIPGPTRLSHRMTSSTCSTILNILVGGKNSTTNHWHSDTQHTCACACACACTIYCICTCTCTCRLHLHVHVYYKFFTVLFSL